MFLECCDGVELGLTSEIAEPIVIVVLGVLNLWLEVDVKTIAALVPSQQFLFSVEMAALITLDLVETQRIVELQLLCFVFVLLDSAQHEFFVGIFEKQLASLVSDERNLLLHNVFNY